MPSLTRGAGRLVTVALLAVVPGLRATAQPSLNRDPERARLITEDIPRFWRVYDSATIRDAAERFERDYLAAGTAGLKGFIPGRLMSGRAVAATVASRPKFYASIRAGTTAIDSAATAKTAIRASFRKLAELYPAAVFPDVFFVVGRINSGGTSVEAGLVIGAEMYARTPATPVEELNAWERAVLKGDEGLPWIVAHELIHYQQAPERGEGSRTLLARALREGAADFVGELISGGIINRAQREYGDAREAELWREFSAAMDGTDVSRWLYQGDQSKDRPADLGYYLGFRICRWYYERAADRRAAVARILTFTDAKAFLAETGYGSQFR